MNPIFHRSPNFDSNREKIDRIVIHWFGIGTLESADARFLSDSSDVSAHYGISGDIIYQWVEEKNVAYHAGVYEMNQRSIGIEYDATTDHDATDLTYETSGKLIANICQKYNIPIDDFHIIPHKQVKATQCPGTIDIPRILTIAKKSIIVSNNKMNDQTKIPKKLLGEDQDLEIQQIRGLLKDGKRDNIDLQNARKENEDLKKQLKICQEGLSKPPKSVENLSASQLFILFLNKFFK